MNLSDYPTPETDEWLAEEKRNPRISGLGPWLGYCKQLERRLAARGAALELVLRRGAGMQRSDQYLNEVLSACRQTLTETAPK